MNETYPVPDGFTPYDGAGPYIDHIGPVLVRETPEGLRFGIPTSGHHANHRGTVQGGLLSTLADFAIGRAIGAESDDEAERATVSLTVDFLRPAQPGDFVEAYASVDRIGSTLQFADCSITVDGREVVRARAVFATAG